MGGSYLENVKRSLVPEFISMNFMMAAMAPVMARPYPGPPVSWPTRSTSGQVSAMMSSGAGDGPASG